MLTNSRHLLMTHGGICLALCVGCANLRNGPAVVQKIEDPPQLPPYNQPLSNGAPAASPTPSGSAYRGPFSGFFTPGTPLRPSPTPNQPFGGQTPPYDVQRPASPGLVPEPREPLDDFGTDLGVPEAIEPTPQANDEPASDSLDGPEDTIRRRPEMDDLQAPTPGRAQPDAPAGDSPSLDPQRQPLSLSVNDPVEVPVGEVAKFEIIVLNPFATAVEDVVIECRFDEGLSFPGLEEQALRQRLGTLGPSESRTIDLALSVESAGQRCVEFSVTADGRDLTREQRCLLCTQQSVQVDLVGPATRTAGGRLECILTLTNQTGREISGVVAALNYDAALEPREASAGAARSPGRLEWDLGLLGSDERVQIQVEFACPTPSEQTCLTALVTGRDLETQRRDYCAVVTPRQVLDVAVADSRDPVPVGETTTYIVTVTNRGLTPLSEVRLDIEVDGGLEIIPAEEGLARLSMTSAPSGSALNLSTAAKATRSIKQPSLSEQTTMAPPSGSALNLSTAAKATRSVRQASLPEQTALAAPIEGPRAATFTLAGPIAPDDVRTIQVDARGTEVGTGGLRVRATEITTELEVEFAEPTVVTRPLLDFPPFSAPARDE